MPTWNRLHLLPDAVQSVLGQSMPDLELLIIDDGSSDGTLEWIRSRQEVEPRVRVLSQDHGGISRALNLGLSHARGEWIARLDSDDVWEPCFLRRQLDLAGSNPEARAIYARAEAAGEDLSPKGILRASPPSIPGDALASLLLGDFTCNITAIARKLDVIRVGGWREEFPHGEDWDLWLRIARLGPFLFNPEVLARYREHGGNITQLCWHDMPEVRAEILRAHFDDPSLPTEARKWRGTAFRRQHVNGAMAAWSVKQRALGWRRLKRSFQEGDGWLATTTYAVVQYAAWCLAPRHPWIRRLQQALLERRDHRRQAEGCG